jgi:riboflavin synthase
VLEEQVEDRKEKVSKVYKHHVSCDLLIVDLSTDFNFIESWFDEEEGKDEWNKALMAPKTTLEICKLVPAIVMQFGCRTCRLGV